MTKQHINIGRSANDKAGDPLRTAFDKVNQNFDELFATDVLTKYHLGDDEQFVDIELDDEGVPTGVVTIQSGFNTSMPVYIKGANALQDGTGGNVIIEAGAPPLAAGLIQGGGGYAGTVGDIEMSANQVTIETLGGTTTFATGGGGAGYVTFPAVDGEQLGIQGNEIGSQPGSNGLALTAYNGSILLATHADSQPVQIWEFDKSGTINTPLLFPLSFTAVLDVEHRTVGTGTYTGPAWEFNLEWQVSPSGQIELLSDTGPLPSLVVGYADGQTFEFTEADHGIPDYTLTVTLSDVQHNPAGWTANLSFSEPPSYPSTINTLGAIKLTSNNNSWTFDTGGYLNLPYGSARILGAPEGLVLDGNGAPGSSNLTLLEAGAFLTSQVDITLTTAGGEGGNWVFDTDGKLTLPAGGDIVDSNGESVLGGTGGGTIWTNDANGCLRVELASTGFQAFTDGTHVDLQDSGTWNIGSYQTNTTISNDGFANPHDLWLRSGSATFITTDLDSGPGNQWMFGGGSLRFPNGTTIGDKPGTGTLSHGPAVDTVNINSVVGTFPGLDFSSPNGVAVGWLVNGPGVTNATILGIDAGNGFIEIDGGAFQVGQSYTFTGTSSISIGTKITVNSNDWIFGTDGKLTLPAGGAITSPDCNFSFNKDTGNFALPTLGTVISSEGLEVGNTGNSEVYMGSGFGEFRSIYNNNSGTESGLTYAGVEGFNYVQQGDVNFSGIVSQTPNIDSMYSVGLNEDGQIVIGFTQNGQTQESTDWSVTVGTLNTDMTVNGLFANTTTTVIGSGLSSWTFGEDSNGTPGILTLPQGSTINDTASAPGFNNGQSVEIKPGGGSNGNQLLRIYPTVPNPDGNHIHITSGDLSVTDLFLGNDDQFVQIATDGKVCIGTYDTSGHFWTFGTDGNLTLPNATTIGNATGTITQGPVQFYDVSPAYNGQFFTLDFTPPYGVAAGWIVNGPGVDNVIVESVNINAKYVNLPVASGQPYQSNQVYTFTSPADLGVGSKITVNSKDWTFGYDGVLNLPANGTITSPDDITLLANQHINISTNHGSQTWDFDGTGKLTLPAGGTITETAFVENLLFGDTQGTIVLTPNNVYNPWNNLTIYNTAFNPETQHIHLASGDLNRTEIVLGNDSKFVKVNIDGSVCVMSSPYYFEGAMAFEFQNTDNTITEMHFSLGVYPRLYYVAVGDIITDVSNGNTATITGVDNAINLSITCSIPMDTNGTSTLGYSFSKPNNNGGLWQFGTDGSLTLPGDLHGAEIFDPSPNGPISAGHQLNITPASNATDKKFEFAINQNSSGVFQNAALQLPTSENNKQVYLSFPGHDSGDSSSSIVSLWNQNTNSGSGEFNNAFNILANGKDIKLTAEARNGSYSTWTFDSSGNLTLPTGGEIKTAAGTGDVVIEANDGTARTWTFGGDGTTLFPDASIDGGTAPIELKSRSWSQLTYNNADMTPAPNKNHSTTFFVEGGDALLEIFRWDGDSVLQHRQWTFSNNGDLSLPDTGTITFPDSTVQTTAYNRTTGSWTLAPGANTVNITVTPGRTYSMWVHGNIDNGIVMWNATVSLSNTNVPALGTQYGWYYSGNQLVLDSIPNQIVGTAGSISTATVATTTSNVFTFGITNNSDSSQIVYWGYVEQ